MHVTRVPTLVIVTIMFLYVVKEIQLKIKNIRSQLSREVKRKSVKSGSSAPNQTKRWLEKKLSFLQDQSTPRSTQTNLQVTIMFTSVYLRYIVNTIVCCPALMFISCFLATALVQRAT